MIRRRLLLALVMGILSTAGICTRTTNNNYLAPSPVPTTPVADLIEFRIFGNVGDVPVAIRVNNSIDGTSNLVAVSLPYVVSLKSLDASIFLDIEARATPPLAILSSATLQAQIFVNGRLFREAFASGITPLVAATQGTWRR